MANTVSCSIVSSRLHYCNALLYGMTQTNFNRLQRAQNSLARVVYNAPFRSSSQPLLKSLHWLPIIERVEYKLAAMTYKVLLYREPSYLLQHIDQYKPVGTQRSSNSTLLKRSTHQNNYSNPRFTHLCPNCLEQPAIWSQRGIFTTSIPAPTQSTSFSTRLLLTIATRRLCIIVLNDIEWQRCIQIQWLIDWSIDEWDVVWLLVQLL